MCEQMFECAKHHDRLLCQRLDKIFRERCLTSSQIKEFVCAPDDTYRNSMIDVILKTERLECDSKEELGKLSLLWIAVLGSYYDLTDLLVRSGANVIELYGLRTIKNFNLHLNAQSTVLHALFQMDPSAENERIIRLVTDHGANLQARDSDGLTVLHIAVMENRDNLIEMLLEKEADLQARDSEGRTALHLAVKKGRVKMAKMLLEKGAEVNNADNKGATPLMFLSNAGSKHAGELLPLLIKYGADASARDHRGRNALHYLSEDGIEDSGVKYTADLARVLIEKGASLHDRERECKIQPIHKAIIQRNNQLVKLYLDHGANVNTRTMGDLSLLQFATVPDNNAAVLKTLLEYGADINQSWPSGTALNLACQFDTNVENIKLLLSFKANVLAEDIHGNTPLASINPENMAKPGSFLIVKELALIKALQPSIELKDEKIIEQYPVLLNHYGNCTEQIERMKFTRFIETCTIFDLLTKCYCQISTLMRNPDFGIKFRNYNLTEFATYAEDIVQDFKRAEKHHQSRLEQEDVINEAFYHTLPYEIVRSVVHYICDCCKNVS